MVVSVSVHRSTPIVGLSEESFISVHTYPVAQHRHVLLYVFSIQTEQTFSSCNYKIPSRCRNHRFLSLCVFVSPLLRTNVPVKRTDAPHFPWGFLRIPPSGIRMRYCHNAAEMSPCEIWHSRVPIWQIIKTQVKLSIIPQSPFTVVCSKFDGQPICNCFNQLGAILSTGSSMLFFFHYTASDVPISDNSYLSDCSVCLSLPLFDNRPDIGNKILGYHIGL